MTVRYEGQVQALGTAVGGCYGDLRCQGKWLATWRITEVELTLSLGDIFSG